MSQDREVDVKEGKIKHQRYNDQSNGSGNKMPPEVFLKNRDKKSEKGSANSDRTHH